MIKMIQTLIAAVFIASMTGCASTKGYFVDRGRDAADIFTIAFGYGAGVKIRAGPIHAGLSIDLMQCGLRGGEFLPPSGELELPGHGLDIDITFSNVECYDPHTDSTNSKARGKCFDMGYWSQVPFISFPAGSSGANAHEGDLGFAYPYYYFSQIEIVTGLLGSIRLGFNPGELLDFFLGWTTLDIFNDDLEARKQKEESNPTSEGIRQSADGLPKPSM